MSQTFKLLKLPPELFANVFKQLPNLWSVISLRQTCHHVEKVYKDNQNGIKKAQRERIVKAITAYYQYLSTLTDFNFEQTQEGWDVDHPAEKTSFTNDVLRHLPFSDQIERNVITCGQHIDWRRNHDPTAMKGNHSLADARRFYHKFETNIARFFSRNDQYLILMTFGNSLVLDTMRSEILCVGLVEPDTVMDVETFFRCRKKMILDWQWIPACGPWWTEIWSVNRYHRPWVKDHRDEVMAIYREHGWPDNWNKEAGLKALQEFWQRYEH